MTNQISVLIGNGTVALAGMVTVRLLVSARGWRICLPESDSTMI